MGEGALPELRSIRGAGIREAIPPRIPPAAGTSLKRPASRPNVLADRRAAARVCAVGETHWTSRPNGRMISGAGRPQGERRSLCLTADRGSPVGARGRWTRPRPRLRLPDHEGDDRDRRDEHRRVERQGDRSRRRRASSADGRSLCGLGARPARASSGRSCPRPHRRRRATRSDGTSSCSQPESYGTPSSSASQTPAPSVRSSPPPTSGTSGRTARRRSALSAGRCFPIASTAARSPRCCRRRTGGRRPGAGRAPSRVPSPRRSARDLPDASVETRSLGTVLTALRILHVLSACVWVGGTVALVFVGVPAIRQLEGEARATAMRTLGRRWRPIGWSAMGSRSSPGSG